MYEIRSSDGTLLGKRDNLVRAQQLAIYAAAAHRTTTEVVSADGETARTIQYPTKRT